MTLVHGFDEASARDHVWLMKNWWRFVVDQACDLFHLELSWRSQSLNIVLFL